MRNMKHNLNTLMVYVIILIGVFTGTIEAASASSNIKIADNGHYFEYDGEQEFLLGLGNWIFMNKIDVDYVA
jgi:hypothetical protein